MDLAGAGSSSGRVFVAGLRGWPPPAKLVHFRPETGVSARHHLTGPTDAPALVAKVLRLRAGKAAFKVVSCLENGATDRLVRERFAALALSPNQKIYLVCRSFFWPMFMAARPSLSPAARSA